MNSVQIHVPVVQPSAPKKTARKAKPSRSPARSSRAHAHARKQVVKIANCYVYGAVVLSSVLNGYASIIHSVLQSTPGLISAAIVGGLIPIGVLCLFKVAGHLYRAGCQRLSIAVGLIGCFLLALSLWHCSIAIATLTGMSGWLSALFAIGIDVGLVGCEVSAIFVEQHDA